jgi:hypothetical protein
MFPRRRSIFQRGRNTEWIKSTYERGVANRRRRKWGIIVLGGGPTRHWMVVSIQASVSDSIY